MELKYEDHKVLDSYICVLKKDTYFASCDKILCITWNYLNLHPKCVDVSSENRCSKFVYTKYSLAYIIDPCLN